MSGIAKPERIRFMEIHVTTIIIFFCWFDFVTQGANSMIGNSRVAFISFSGSTLWETCFKQRLSTSRRYKTSSIAPTWEPTDYTENIFNLLSSPNANISSLLSTRLSEMLNQFSTDWSPDDSIILKKSRRTSLFLQTHFLHTYLSSILHWIYSFLQFRIELILANCVHVQRLHACQHFTLVLVPMRKG